MVAQTIDFSPVFEIGAALPELMPPLAAYDFEIAKRHRAIGEHVLRGGIGLIQEDLFEMNDKSRFKVQKFTSSAKRFDTDLTYTGPWYTELEGFNTELGIAAAEQGIDSIAVSSDQVSFLDTLRILGQAVLSPEQLKRLKLSHDAYAQHLILDAFNEDGDTNVNQVINFGYSRGAMEGYGLQAYAPQFKRKIVYGDYIDPCIEHPIDIRNIHIPELPGSLKVEVTELAKAIFASTRAERHHLRRTLDLTPSNILKHLSVGAGLVNGEAGKLARHIPKDALIFNTLFSQSMFNDASYWQATFADHFRTGFTIARGAHITGAHPKFRAAAIGRIVRIEELLQSGVDVSSIDIDDVVNQAA